MQSVFDKLAARPQRSILLLSLLLLLAGNWILPLTDRDEARFGEASREMLRRGDYVVPWFNDEWRLYKPALIYWCQIASYRVLGDNDFAARFPSVVFTTATALVLVRWGRKVADARTGFLAGAMYVAGLHIAILGRMATADLALFFCFTLTVWSGWELTRPEQPQRRKWWWIFYVAMALGFLAKGPVAWLPFGAMLLGRAWRKNAFRLPLTETLVGFVLALALVSLWGIPALVQTSGQFWSVGMGEHVIHRAIAVNDSHGLSGLGGFLLALPLYFLTFFISFFPWSTRVPTALRRWWPERGRDDLGWYLLMNAAVVFLVFTLVKTKLPHYTLPAFSCLALWLALQISPQPHVATWFGRRLAAMSLLVLTLMLAGSSFFQNRLLTENLWHALQPHVRPETRLGSFGYTEPSIVWRFRQVITNQVTLDSVTQARDFLTNSPPYILVLPTSDLAQLPDTNGLLISVHGLDMVRLKNWKLTALVRP
jgi:4-amino-4-deoxy-L-arabinose transferase-like glycosyltransferase